MIGLPHTGAGSDDASNSSKALILRWAALAPPLLVAAFALLLGLGVSSVTTWFWPPSTTNIVEAVWLKETARVRVLASRQESLNATLPVRPELLDRGAPASMTPLEAAVRSESDAIVAIVLELGARPTLAEARRLQCVAVEIGANGAAVLLAQTFTLPLHSCSQ
jgi:hypothetical protein